MMITTVQDYNLQSQDGKQNYSISVRISKFIIDSVLERRIPSCQPRGSPNNFENPEEGKPDSFSTKWNESGKTYLYTKSLWINAR